MKTTVSEPEVWKRVVEIEVPESEVDAAVDAKLAAIRRDTRMPGFRQGKVPAAVVRQRYGKAARAEAVEEVMQNAFKSACEEHKINPVSESKLIDVKGGEGEGEALRFTIETEVDPPVEINGYDRLKARAKPAKVTDAMVDEAFNNYVDRYADFEDVSRPAKKGDYLQIRYKSVSIDGAERPDLKDHCPEYPIELGGEGVFKEFDKGLAGKSAGDSADIGVKFPKDYADTGVAGKNGEFSVEVLSVQEKHPPELNDEFFQKIGVSTAAVLKDEIRKSMEGRTLLEAKDAAHNEAIDEIIRENQIKLAPATVDALARRLIDDYVKRGETVREEQLEQFYGVAALMLKRAKIIEYVAEKEKIKATQEDVDREIMLMAQQYGQDFDVLKQVLRKDGTTNRIRSDIRERKTLDFLIGESNAN
ncbi:trigger factor [Fibrobacteres bacterium R8-0-B4]